MLEITKNHCTFYGIFSKILFKHYLVRKALTFVAASLNGIDAGLIAFKKGLVFTRKKRERPHQTFHYKII